MRLGIFGGTFDPPHLGHLVLAAEACSQLDLRQVLWVLTPDPPHKTDREITPYPLRLELLEAALEGEPAFQVSRVDIDRPPPHYAVDTMRLLHQSFPNAELIYLMGADSLEDLPEWHRPQDFVAACDGLGVMHRPGYVPDLQELERRLPGLAARIAWFQAPLLEISSSEIRRRAAEGRPFRYFLPPAVYQIIQARKLYLPG